MTTLANIRAALNTEVGVDSADDLSGDLVFPFAARNAAIAAAYADLWRMGVWKDAKQDLTTVADQHTYALTAIRRLTRLELLDSGARLVEKPKGVVEPDGAGTNTYQLRLNGAITAGYTLRVRGFAPYLSVFASDATSDDLPAENLRIPILKAKVILYENQRALFARYGEKQALPSMMNVTLESLIGMIQVAAAEYREAVRTLSGLRQRSGQLARL